MAGQRLTDKTLLSENLAPGDLLMVVDTSDTTGSADGTSKKIANKHIIQTDTVTGNLDLNSNPLTLVAAPGAGSFIQPLTITIIYTYNSSASTGSNFMFINYDSTDYNEYIISYRDFLRSKTTSQTYQLGCVDRNPPNGVYEGILTNRPLIMSATADLGGNSSFKVYTTYQIVTI
jgi:hypothetical protein